MKVQIDKFLKKYSYDTNKVVGIDPFDFDNRYLLENGVLQKIKPKDLKQEYLLSSYIPNDKVITYELKLPKNLLDKLDKLELDDLIETKCYEDMGLDEAEEYIFKYKIIENIEDKNFQVEVVIIEQSALKEFYQPILKESNYLDFITYSGFVFEVLYKEKIIEPHNDLFIYFTKDNIFITLYSDGEFRQTVVIPESLENIYQILTNSIEIKNFDFNKFLKLLIKKGLDYSNYNEKENILFNELSELFSNKFLIISNQINLIVRKFALTTIDRIFMSTIKGSIPGISEFANMYLGVESNDLKFDTDYNPNNVEIDQILFLSMLYAKYAYTKDYHIDNVELFRRPPTFFYRKSGQLITISITSFILSISYPIYQVIDSYILEYENSKLTQELNHYNSINSKLTNQNKKLNNILKSKIKQRDELNKYIQNSQKVIVDIYKEKKKYIQKSVLIAKISKYLKQNNVFLSQLNYRIGVLSFIVYAKDDKNITSFLNDLVKKEHLIVDTDGYIQEDGVFKSKIIVRLEDESNIR